MKKMILKLGHFIIIFIFPILISAEELIVVTENWRPYNFEENREIKGVSTKIVKKVLEHAGIKYGLNVYPWNRAYNMALYDRNVLIYTIIKVAPRENKFKWIRPLGKGGTSSLYRLKKNTHINPKTIEEAKKYDIVANKNSMDHLWLEYKGFPNLDTPTAVAHSIRMLFKGRVDMIVFDDSVLKNEFESCGFDINQVSQVMPLFKTLPYMALSLTTSDDILEKLQKSYDQLIKEKKIDLVN
ncbi:MAG: amino acid ABC transporter substrate-binding protein [Desulfobacterales bacterium]|nr:amino acid ABC transporter substrate-binding protein [Desulfobacterales bacterium]